MKKYLAFISYRHLERDQQISAILMKGLEGYHLPKDCGLPSRRRVFRDTDELPTGSDLGTDIENALKDSEYLITLCSDEYMASRWCLREVELYLEMGRKDRILPVLIAGTPETAIPPEIQDLPLAADLRSTDERDNGHAGGGSPDLRKAKAAVPKLLSRMSGTEEEAIVASERGFRLKVLGCAAAFVLAGILGFASYALHTSALIESRNREIVIAAEQAEKAREEAVAERNEAILKNAAFAAEQAMAAYNAGNDEEALRIALSVIPEDLHREEPVSVEALGALRMVMSRQRDIYRLTFSTETDFEITGCQRTSSEALLLEQEEYSEKGTVLYYETGELEELESETRKRAFAAGHSRGSMIRNYTRSSAYLDDLYYGPEKPAQIRLLRGGEVLLTVRGEPFYMDHMVQEPVGDLVFGWLEETPPGQPSVAALFSTEDSDAVRPSEVPGDPGTLEPVLDIELDAPPITAEISADIVYHTELAVLTQEGKLRLYSTETGTFKRELPGTWSDIHYPGELYRICAANADGSGWSLLDTGTGEALVTVETPSPVRDMDFCAKKSALLCRFDDGVRVYDLESGRLLNQLLTAEPLVGALWGQGEDGRFLHDGNMIVLVFPKRVEIWSLVTDIDTELNDVIPLYKEDLYNRCEYAFYSPDGSTVFLQMITGDLSAWDARTGEFLWLNEGDWNPTGSHVDTVFSEDGDLLWRRHGIDCIDPVRGETLYRLNFGGNTNTPILSPDRKLAVIPGVNWSGMRCFDPKTGEELWKNDDYGQCVFSEDSKEVLYIELRDAAEEYAQELCWRRIDAFTGKVLEEKILLHKKPGEDFERLYYLWILPEQKPLMAYSLALDAKAGSPLLLIDMEKGEIAAEVKVPGDSTNAVIMDTGALTLQWKSEGSGDYDQCCSVEMDGKLGPVCSVWGEEGRRLKIMDTQRLTFAGEEAELDMQQIDRRYTFQSHYASQILRLSDGAVLLDAGDCNIAAPAAGPSVCIYSRDTTPLLILDSDPDEMVAKARRRLEGQL
ncbi:MAG: toll/interleukin-1 receptor domain-containing protein [Stomatobaculum sp.]|nr:toll/interleukin-1 receptor domain-containing protein [Stomatobaculum sp.]